MIEIIVLSVTLAIAWVDYLVAEDGILDFIPGLVFRIWENEKFNKVIWQCEVCLSGQISLWTYLGAHWSSYNLLEHVSTVSISIVATASLKRLLAL